MAERTCTIEGCDRPFYARGWCCQHYQRWHRHGDPTRRSAPRPDVRGNMRERLLRNVTIAASGCWQWRYVHPDGYSITRIGGVAQMAHRAVYKELVGPIPDDVDLDHVCHSRDVSCPGGSSCSHRSCVNPDHLEPVPHGENIRRARRNNWLARKTHCPQGHPYSGINLRYGSRGCPVCRKCEHASKRRYLARKAEAAGKASD